MKKLKRILLILMLPTFVCLSASAFDHHDKDGGKHDKDGGDKDGGKHDHDTEGGGGSTNAPTRVPLNGGIALLVLAGVGLGAKKIMNDRKRNTEPSDPSI